jgi:gamma-glutamylcyclotransferase (GGCT)/AIG2-like uncharacterized protein YtfP
MKTPGLPITERIRHFFVYGSLRQGMRHPLHHVLYNRFKYDGPATLQSILYDLGKYPGVVASDQPDDIVQGDLLRLRDDCEDILRVLDGYEGCAPGMPYPREYKRVAVWVTRADEEATRVPVWVYLYDRQTWRFTRVEDGDWVAYARELNRRPTFPNLK